MTNQMFIGGVAALILYNGCRMIATLDRDGASMSSISRIFAGATILTGLAGCAADLQRYQMKSALDQFIGRSIADHIAMKGPPIGSVPLGNGRAVFNWLWNESVNRPGIVAPIGGMMVYAPPTTITRTCMVALIAQTNNPKPTYSDWIIQGYRWEGQC